MSRTPLFERLRNAFAVAHEAGTRNIPVEQAIAERGRFSGSRRDFIVGAAAALGTMAIGRPVLAGKNAAPRIAVVGAGLAGLTCAYRLRQAGYQAAVFEASDRVGGRCWTLRGAFGEGQMIEKGGELIDQGHTQIRQLCQEFRLPLDDLLQAETNGTEPFYYFDGTPYTFVQATNDMKAVWQKLHRDVVEAGYPTLYNSYTPRGLQLDRMSIVDWINESVPGGINSKLGQLLDVAYNIEFGAESGEQSSLNLIYLLGYRGQGQLRLFGPSNEKFHIRGGNDLLVSSLANSLGGQIFLGAELKAVKRNNDGTFTLNFKNGAPFTAEKVVLALPFSILRNSVDLSGAGFSALKMTAINEQGMGANSKLQLQFTDRHWRNLGSNGDTFADTGYQASWEVTRGQAGRAGILNDYTGGVIAARLSGPLALHAERFLSQIEPVFPGISAKWNGRAALDNWSLNRFTRGSYSFWKVGQYTKFSGIERERQGNCHFAGEHTSIDFQGYLNGAVETGERAANEIIDDFR